MKSSPMVTLGPAVENENLTHGLLGEGARILHVGQKARVMTRRTARPPASLRRECTVLRRWSSQVRCSKCEETSRDVFHNVEIS